MSAGKLDLKLTSGETNASGSAELTFDMPEKWSNGDEVKSGTMVLVVKAEDSSFTRSASILYYKD